MERECLSAVEEGVVLCDCGITWASGRVPYVTLPFTPHSTPSEVRVTTF